MLLDFLAEKSFCCGFQFPKTFEKKYKPLEKYVFFTDTRSTCTDNIDSAFYEIKLPDPLPCGRCLAAASSDVKTMYTEQLKIYNSVVPNCGSESCLQQSFGISGLK